MVVKDVDFEDRKAWQFLRTGKTAGVFQFDKEECTDILRRLKINDLNTLVDVNALNRPGPKDAGMVDSYIKRKAGKEVIEYDHPALEPILRDTCGIILFQEQCITIASALAGYSLADADNFRKTISKKDEQLNEERTTFVEGCLATQNIPADQANAIFDKIATFADYGFNKSHSVCYAVLGYWLAYLKANYPIEFMTNVLSAQTVEEEMRRHMAECRQLDIAISPPHINESRSSFNISKSEKQTIIFGLSSIKGIGKGVAEYIAANQPYSGVLDFIQRADKEIIKADVVEKLLKAGCFRKADKEFTTKQILSNLPSILKAFKTDKFVATKNTVKLMLTVWGKQTIKRGEAIEFDDIELAHMEREMLGFYVTTHPMRHLKNPEALTSKGYVPISRMKDAARRFYTIGVLTKKVKSKKSRKGKIFHELSIEDEYGSVNLPVFNPMDGLTDLEQGDVIVLQIKKSRDRFYPEKFRKLND